ncbi:MAG: energy transducer TonB [Bacteroidetes bacterium]|nr:energy transducer TonB [Bacteroidota bacterium]
MRILTFVSILFLSSYSYFGQGKVISVSAEAEIKGGRESLEQVMETQLTLPKLILTKEFAAELIVYFELDSLDRAKSITFNSSINNLLSKEIKRILKFLRFNRKTSVSETPYEYFLTLHLSAEKYNKYMKQRVKPFVKTDKPADSSYVIHGKADKSPEFYKGGDDGLAEYIIDQIQYPDIAKEKSIQGTVVLEFVVETNGFVTGIVINQGVGGGCTEEALRIMKQTKWQPAVLNNRYVRYKMSYPITFNLENNFRDNTAPRQGSGY